MEVFDLRNYGKNCLDHPFIVFAYLLVKGKLGPRAKIIVDTKQVGRDGLYLALDAYGYCIESEHIDGDTLEITVYKCRDGDKQR